MKPSKIPTEPTINVHLLAQDIDPFHIIMSFTVTLAGTAAVIYLQRKLMNPDATRELSMRVFRAGRAVCQSQADFWSANAARCATAYQKASL